MLMKYEDSRRRAGRILADNARSLAFRLAYRLRHWLLIVRDIGRLEQLDDHLLRDIGIPRDEIAARVKGRR